jgi:hypothetical protein
MSTTSVRTYRTVVFGINQCPHDLICAATQPEPVYSILILSAHLCLGQPGMLSSSCCALWVYSELSPWSKMYLGTLIVAQPLGTYFVSYITKCSLPCSQQPFVGLCPGLTEYSPQPPIPISYIYFNIILPSTLRSFKNYFPFMFLIEIVNAFLIYPVRSTFHAHLIFSVTNTLIIFSKEHDLCSSSFCNFLILFCPFILRKNVKLSQCLMNEAP